MKERPRQPLFLARQSYRQRRLMDAARLLPVLGAFLFLLPVLWGPRPGTVEGRATASDGIYIFLAWAGLILAAFLMSRALAAHADGDGPRGAAPGEAPEEPRE